jgi:GT2 family glycosyltransferase
VKIVFVILHYMALKETEESVEQIRKKIDTDSYHIIIVDNASVNGTGLVLKKKHQSEEDITIILNHENQGFAKGNNVGFVYAKNKWNPQYIVLMNNDVLLLENKFVLKLDEEFKQSCFAVLGPMIMTKDGRCDVNPQKAEFLSIDAIDKKIKHYKRELKRYHYKYASIYYKLAMVKGVFCGKTKIVEKDFLKRKENVKLHGCFLVFSQEYIKDFDGLDERTFLFWEEEFLYKHMISNEKKMVYNPDIQVFHMEDAATDAAIKGRREKMIFMLTHYIHSLQMLKDVYIKYDKNIRK